MYEQDGNVNLRSGVDKEQKEEEVKSIQNPKHRRRTVSSFDFYSSTFNSRLVRRFQKIINASPADSRTRFYVNAIIDDIEGQQKTVVEDFASNRDANSDPSTNSSRFQESPIMDVVAKRLRKFWRRSSVSNDEHRSNGLAIHNPCVECEYCPNPNQRDEADDEAERMEKKIRKFIKNMNSDKWSTTKSQDRKPYSTIMTLLLSQYGHHRNACTEASTLSQPTCSNAGGDGKIIRTTTCGCQHCIHAHSKNIDESFEKEEKSDHQISDLSQNQVMVRVFACVVSRSSIHEPFGLHFQCSSDQKRRPHPKIVSIEDDSAASKMDLRTGDKVIAVNGRRLEEDDNIENVLEQLLEAKLVVERINGQKIDQDMIIGKSADQNSASTDDPDMNENIDDHSRPSRSKTRPRDPWNDDTDLERWLDRVRVYPRGTIMDRFPEARAFLRLTGKGTYSEEYRDCNVTGFF